MHIEGNLTRPLHGILAHITVYYKYKTYQRWAVDVWEDICGHLSGTKSSYLMLFTVNKVLNYTNINHPCPYEGNVYIKVNNISIDAFPFEPLVPSGRYRVDVDLTEGKKDNVIVMVSLYVEVSDHRIEQI